MNDGAIVEKKKAMDGCLVKIRQGLSTFSPTEQKIGEFILKNPYDVLELSISKLAEKSSVSEASVVRFCRNIGLKGYQELKIMIAGELNNSGEASKTIHKNITTEDNTEAIIEKIFSSNISALQDTMQVISSLELEKSIQLLEEAKRITFFGIGASSIVALDAQYKFMRINMPASMHFDVEMQLALASNLSAGDLAIGITNSGRTKDIVKMLKIAKQNGANTICITQFGDSPVQRYSDVKLHTAAVESTFRSGAMASLVAQLSIIDALFVGLALKRHDQVISSLEKTREVVKNRKY
ncbi:MAG: transcriptional regulator, RpiR family [Firmicutes bacterium]|nr:transcriptional regulator, RpiR family [Bacillota bacterium]